MLVMPANASGWFWHCLARETGKIGHLYSPGAQRGPWPWFDYALDNGAFSCWDRTDNTFNDAKWSETEKGWRALIYWAASAVQRPRWAIVPDRPGSRDETLDRWEKFVQVVLNHDIPPAIAVQDGMTPADVKGLKERPQVVCVGGTTEWKWQTVEMWKKNFQRVHVLRCNSPDKLQWLEQLGIESCDGTGWNRGDKRQTIGLENWARRNPQPKQYSLAAYTCRKPKQGQLEWAF